MARVYCSDTLWVKNFDEIALSRTVKEIEVNLCFAIFGQNFKIQNGRHFWGGENFLKTAKSTFLGYLALSRTVKDIEANLCFPFLAKYLSSYYSVSYIAIITKTNPKQAIDLSNAYTKFGKDMSNIFP